MDLETDLKFVDYIAKCYLLGLDPENPNLPEPEFRHRFFGQPWLAAWEDKMYSSDVDMTHLARLNIKSSAQIPNNSYIDGKIPYWLAIR